AVKGGRHVVDESATADKLTTAHAVAWAQAGGMVDVGTLGGCRSGVAPFGHAINASGQVVGTSSTAGDQTNHAFSWTEAGGMVDLGTLGGYSAASAVNDNGQVVGESATADSPQHAFSWTEAGGMIDLG